MITDEGYVRPPPGRSIGRGVGIHDLESGTILAVLGPWRFYLCPFMFLSPTGAFLTPHHVLCLPIVCCCCRRRRHWRLFLGRNRPFSPNRRPFSPNRRPITAVAGVSVVVGKARRDCELWRWPGVKLSKQSVCVFRFLASRPLAGFFLSVFFFFFFLKIQLFLFFCGIVFCFFFFFFFHDYIRITNTINNTGYQVSFTKDMCWGFFMIK